MKTKILKVQKLKQRAIWNNVRRTSKARRTWESTDILLVVFM